MCKLNEVCKETLISAIKKKMPKYDMCSWIKLSKADEIDKKIEELDELEEYISTNGVTEIFQVDADKWLESEGIENIDFEIEKIKKQNPNLTICINDLLEKHNVYQEISEDIKKEVQAKIEKLSMEEAIELISELLGYSINLEGGILEN
jgi:hypothetical protein